MFREIETVSFKYGFQCYILLSTHDFKKYVLLCVRMSNTLNCSLRNNGIVVCIVKCLSFLVKLKHNHPVTEIWEFKCVCVCFKRLEVRYLDILLLSFITVGLIFRPAVLSRLSIETYTWQQSSPDQRDRACGKEMKLRSDDHLSLIHI